MNQVLYIYVIYLTLLAKQNKLDRKLKMQTKDGSEPMGGHRGSRIRDQPWGNTANQKLQS